MSLLGLVPWYWRLGAIAALALACAGFGAVKMHEHDERVLEEFKTRVQVAGDEQNARTAATVKAWKDLKEASDHEANLRVDALNARVAAVQLRLGASARRGIVPAAPAGTNGGQRICYARDELDRRLGEDLAGLYSEVVALAERGQRAADVASICRDWAKSVGAW